MSLLDTIWHYAQLGFTHVLPLGYDHILFILSICFLEPKARVLVLQCSIFTVAHSLTLGLTSLGYIVPNSSVIEPLIALSILATAVENIVLDRVRLYRYCIIFCFGLIHGMGFATALQDIGIPRDRFFPALLSFNFGVELGQIAVITVAYFACIRWVKDRPNYRDRVVYPISIGIGCIALYWTLLRLF